MVCKFPFPYKNRQFNEKLIQTEIQGLNQYVVIFTPNDEEDRFGMNSKCVEAKSIIGCSIFQ